MAVPIKCKAMVAWAAAEPLKLETIEVQPPKKGEVRIKMEFTSVCKSDIFGWRGEEALDVFPYIPGHEGSGIVESIGEGVKFVKPGDKVVPFFMRHCEDCKNCKSKATNICESFTFGVKAQLDGTTRYSCNGKPLWSFIGISTFTEYSVLPEICVAKLDPGAPLESVPIIGCGLSTGLGAALNTANVQKGQSVAIFGLGAVGLAVAVGAEMRGAARIIGVDIDDSKFEVAKKFGVNEFVNPNKHKDRLLHEVMMELTGGGVDHAFECVGNVKLMETAIESTHLGWGQTIILGVTATGQMIETAPANLLFGRSLKGSIFGDWKGRDDIPKLVKQYMDGELIVDEFITHRRDSMSELNEVFQLLMDA